MATSAPPQLPSDADLDVTDYKIGSAVSDIDSFRTLLERAQAGDIETIEEYELLKAAGELPSKPEHDQNALARIIVWALDWISDADKIRRDAQAIQHAALALYHDNGTVADVDRHWQRANDWHRAALEDRTA